MLAFLCSNVVCLGVLQYAFLRLNFCFHLLSVAFIAATQKSHTALFFFFINCSTCQQLKNQKKIKTCLEKIVPYSSSQLLSQDGVLFRARASTKDGECCLILQRKDSAAWKLAVRWPGHPYHWPRLAKRQNIPPIRLAGGGSALVKWLALP